MATVALVLEVRTRNVQNVHWKFQLVFENKFRPQFTIHNKLILQTMYVTVRFSSGLILQLKK